MKLIVRNKKVFESLKILQTTGYQYCYLIAEESENAVAASKNEKDKKKLISDTAFFEFMYNPEMIQESYQINYSETQIPYSELAPVNFNSGGNSVWFLSDLILDGFDEKRSIQPLLDKLKSLRSPSVANKIKNAPKRLYLKWGGFKFGLCVLTNVDVKITRWVDGFPATARVSLTLKEVPKEIDNKNSEIIKKLEKATTAKTIKQTLTDKQSIDAQKRVTEYLNTRRSFLPSRVQDTLKSRKYTIKINKESGQIDLLDGNGSLVAILGVYNGDKFKPS